MSSTRVALPHLLYNAHLLPLSTLMLFLSYVGDLHKAAGHLETFYRLALKHKWHTDSGDSLHEIACEHLRRVYTSIAEEVCKYILLTFKLMVQLCY